MSLTQQIPVNNYFGNGTTFVFPFTFKILSSVDLKILIDQIEQSSGFEIEGIGDPQGGTVTFYEPPLEGTIITFQRAVSIDRSTDYLNGGSLNAETLDNDFDRIVMMIQDLNTFGTGSTSSGLMPGSIEYFIATEGQTVITTTNPITVGRNSIDVYRNGLYQVPDVDYVESSGTSITFAEPLLSGDQVAVEFVLQTILDSISAEGVLVEDNYFTSTTLTGVLDEIPQRFAYSGTNTNITSLEGLIGGVSTADYVKFDQTAAPTPEVAKLSWNNDDGTLEFGLKGGNVTLQIGQEQVLYVFNDSDGPLTDGQVVYISGSQGNRPAVKLASASAELTSANTIGVVTESIAYRSTGFITLTGLVRNFDTSAYPEGTQLWLSTTPGQFTSTKPTAPAHGVAIGWVTRQHAQVGSLLIHVQNGYELDELHNVIVSNPTAGQLLGYNGSVWQNTSVVGYTGSRGYTGSQGIQGVIGYTGSQGIQGPIGYTGSRGASSGGVNLTDYPSLRDALAVGGKVSVPSTVTNITVSTTDSPYVLPYLDRVSTEGDLTITLDAGVHTTTVGNIANIGQNENITITGATPISTSLTSVASVSGNSGDYSVVYNLADASGVSVGDYIKIDNAIPLLHLSGDLSVFRQRIAQNELLRTSALLGTITAATGGGSASWSSVGAGVLTDYISVGDLLTIKGQTRVISSVGTSSVNITGSWTLGVSSSNNYFVSRPNSGTVGTGGVSSVTVTGVSSQFTTEANIGDLLLCDGQMSVITAIASATTMTVSPPIKITTGAAYSIITPAVAHEGTHRVTGVAGNAVTVVNHWRGTYAPPVNRVSGGDVQVIKTVLYNSGSGDGFAFEQNSSIKFISNLVLRGSGASSGTHGIALNGRTAEGPTQIGPSGICNIGDGVGIVEWGRGAFVGVGGNLQSRKTHYCGNLNFGIWTMEGADLAIREAIVTGNAGRGIQVNAGTTLLFTEGLAAGNSSDGVNVLDGATLYGEIPFFWQNGGMGLRLGGTAGCHVANGVLGLNAASGIYLDFNATCDISLCLVVANARENIEAYNGSRIYASEVWSVSSRGSAGNGRGIYADSVAITATGCAITGNNGGPVELTGANGMLDAPSSYFTGTANGGVRIRNQSRAVLTNGKMDNLTVAKGANVLIDGVSPTPILGGVARVNEYANDGSIINTGAGTSYSVNSFSINAGSRMTFFKAATAVFDCPSIPAGGQQTTTIAVSGASTSNMVAFANTNSAPAGLALTAHILTAGIVTVTFNNLSSAAIDPGNATISVVVIGGA